MKSMTGYGKCTATIGNRELTVEMKSVNNRYLEINMRLPKVLSALEEVVRSEVKKCILRGSVDVYFNYSNLGGDQKNVVVDTALVRGYVSAAKQISSEFKIKNNFSVSDVFKIPDAVKVEAKEEDADVLEQLMREAVAGACAQLCEMREKEGLGVKQDLASIASNIEAELGKVVSRASDVVSEYAKKLRARVSELLGEVEVDENKLASEIAFFADKADINEEISRLKSHLVQFYETLESEEQVGRKLDFLSQEMNREINTMGSKANDSMLTGCVLKMKNELEKIKEQIRNVE